MAIATSASFLYLRFAWNVVKMNRCRGRNLRNPFLNRLPFFFRAHEINVGYIATEERISANARDAIGDYDARQAIAILKRIFINFIYFSIIILRQYQFRIVANITKQIVHPIVGIEQISVLIVNLTFSLMDFFCIISNISVEISSASERKIGMINDFDKLITTIERRIANARDSVTNRYARQAMAIPERIIANARDAIANRYARQATAILERIIANARDTVGNRYARQATAIIERPVANARDAVGNRDTRQATAIIERMIANARDAVGKYHIRH